ncbi:YhhN-like protein [Trichophaea hybrida]|nr:YhhN-like protein [Trichophaea hybrida]
MLAGILTLSFPLVSTVYLLLISLPLLVFSESRSLYLGSVVFKIFCSIAFVIGPLVHVSPQQSSYSLLITSGLLLSLIGDILLIPSRNEYYYRPHITESSAAITPHIPVCEPAKAPTTSTSFKLGILAFACAHVAYIIAILQEINKLSRVKFLGTFVATIVTTKLLGIIYPALTTATWSNILGLAIVGEMRPMVFAYVIVISAMLAVSASTAPPSSSTCSLYQWVLGAAMFVVSDVFVAIDAFGRLDMYSGEKVGQGKHRWPRKAVEWALYFWGQILLAGSVQR